MADEYDAGADGLPEDSEPLTAGDAILPSIYGEEIQTTGDAEVTHGESDEQLDSAMTLDASLLLTGLATSAGYKASLAGGLYNADFSLGPPRPEEPLSDSNPLPFWRVGVNDSGGGTHPPAPLYWVEDTSAPGGHAIEARWSGASVASTAVSPVFIEQVIPVAPRERYVIPRGLFDWTTGNEMWGRVVAVPFAADGTALAGPTYEYQGIPRQDVRSFSEYNHAEPSEVAAVPAAVPEGTRYMLVRYEFTVDPEDVFITTMNTCRLLEATAGRPSVEFVSLAYFYEDITVTAGATSIFRLASLSSAMASGKSTLESFVTPLPGWVASISYYANATQTSGSLAIQLFDIDQGANIGPYLVVDGTNGGAGDPDPVLYANAQPNADRTSAAGTDSGDADAWNYFGVGSRLRLDCHVTSVGNFAPTGVDAVCYVTLALLDENFADVDNH